MFALVCVTTESFSACRDYAILNLKESRGAIGISFFFLPQILMFHLKRESYKCSFYWHQWFHEEPLETFHCTKGSLQWLRVVQTHNNFFLKELFTIIGELGSSTALLRTSNRPPSPLHTHIFVMFIYHIAGIHPIVRAWQFAFTAVNLLNISMLSGFVSHDRCL